MHGDKPSCRFEKVTRHSNMAVGFSTAMYDVISSLFVETFRSDSKFEKSFQTGFLFIKN